MIRPDLLFSYWVFAWAILWCILGNHVKPHIYVPNPKLSILVGLAENIGTLIALIFSGASQIVLLKFLLVIVVSKIVLLYFVWNEPIHFIQDLVILWGVFLLYNLYLFFQRPSTNILDIYRKTFDSIMENRADTPGFYLMDKIYYFTKE